MCLCQAQPNNIITCFQWVITDWWYQSWPDASIMYGLVIAWSMDCSVWPTMFKWFNVFDGPTKHTRPFRGIVTVQVIFKYVCQLYIEWVILDENSRSWGELWYSSVWQLQMKWCFLGENSRSKSRLPRLSPTRKIISYVGIITLLLFVFAIIRDDR